MLGRDVEIKKLNNTSWFSAISSLFVGFYELKRLHFRLQDGRNGNVTIHAEDQSGAILLWEQQWVRWSGRQEIRWLCPPHRSLSPRQPSDAAAPLLSICRLPSRNLPLNSQLRTCIHIQSDCTIKFMVTVRLFFFFFLLICLGRCHMLRAMLVEVPPYDPWVTSTSFLALVPEARVTGIGAVATGADKSGTSAICKLKEPYSNLPRSHLVWV